MAPEGGSSSVVEAEGEFLPFTGMRGAVARSMEAAWQAPRVTVARDVRLDACIALRDRVQSEGGRRLSPTAYIARAAALALTEHPHLNGSVTEKGVQLSSDVNLGIAVSVEGGLVAPVVRGAAEKSVAELAEAIEAAATLAREGRIAPADVRGGTFTLTSLGPAGAKWFTPIINAPQIAILGVGAGEARPVVDDDGGVGVGTVTTLTLVFDHRATDGHPATLFLRRVCDLLEGPELL